MKKKITYLFLLLCTVLAISCQKELDSKPSKSLVVPATADDFQAIMDNTNYLTNSWPYSVQAATDEAFISYDNWSSATVLTARNVYVWEADVFNDNTNNDWSLPYRTVFNSNVVIEGTSGQTGADWSNVCGQAFFWRAFAYWQLANVFAPAYDPQSASSDLGIVLRNSSDLNIPSVRSTVQQSYDQIITDLKRAASLLPVLVPTKTRPGKQAAYALLARAYLSKSDYTNGPLYADSALQINANLNDFNTLSTTTTSPFKRYNDEVIFHTTSSPTSLLTPPKMVISDAIYNSYNSNDLRKVIYYKIVKNTTMYGFYGSYDGTTTLFNGLATDEVFLIKAECAARLNNPTLAMSTLNTLLITRYKTGSYITQTAIDANDALNKVLAERKKELIFRGTRWSDLKRLNKETQFATTITRNLNGQTYTLAPGSPRYQFQIPLNVIGFTNIQQNNR